MNRNRNDILDLIKFISNSKNIDKELVISFLKNSIKRIINSQLDPDADITLEIIENQLILTNLNKLVIADEEEYHQDSKVVDIHLSDAQKINPSIKIGQTVSSVISFDDFTRTTYAKIEQSFRIEIINWEKKRVYEKYQPLIGTEVLAKLEDDFGGRGATFILEDGTLCYMPAKYQNRKINLPDKKFHNVTIEEVYEVSKNYQVLVSNDSPNKVREILKNEIPEIESGDIQIVGISRIKGERAKISFRKNPNYQGELDVIGSIIGPSGSRINRVCEQFGEKIDVILYSENIVEYISNALSPAKIVSVNKKATTNDFLVVVPDKHNTLAIGKKGSNVKLTVELIRVNIDICSYTYAMENNIPINWNGNLNPEQLKQIEEGTIFNNRQNNTNNRPHQPKRSSTNPFNINIDEFEKEIEEYNSEISAYEPVDYSSFEFASDVEEASGEREHLDTKEVLMEVEELQQEQTIQKPHSKSNKFEIKKINDNFKFDSDIVGDIDLEDIDFSDFEDEF